MYTEKVLDHFEHPRNVGALDDANGVGMVGNAKCGDIMQMFLKVNDDGIIEDVGFKTFGCGAAIATSSMATEMIKGKTLKEALKLTNKAVAEALDGLPPVKMHCSLLAEEGQKHRRSAPAFKFRRCGGAGRSAPAEDTLFRACRRSRPRGHSGLLPQEGHGGQGQGS